MGHVAQAAVATCLFTLFMDLLFWLVRNLDPALP